MNRSDFPPSGMPVDIDGAGDWTVAGWVNPYSEAQWEKIKTWFKGRRIFGLHVLRISDAANTDRSKRDPAAVAQFLLGIPIGIGIVLMFAVLVTACILPWVMRH